MFKIMFQCSLWMLQKAQNDHSYVIDDGGALDSNRNFIQQQKITVKRIIPSEVLYSLETIFIPSGKKRNLKVRIIENTQFKFRSQETKNRERTNWEITVLTNICFCDNWNCLENYQFYSEEIIAVK